MKKILLALTLLAVQPAHAMYVTGGALYDDGSTFDFIWDDSRSNEWYPDRPYTEVNFVHGDFRIHRINHPYMFLVESPDDIGDDYGDSLLDSWYMGGIDFTLDDYYFTPTEFAAYGGNDSWYEGYSVHPRAVRSYLSVRVPEPGTWELMLLGVMGLFALARKRIKLDCHGLQRPRLIAT